MKTIALLPAHNEASGITEAVTSLTRQSCPPDRIVVICDNCTDNTQNLAEKAGAETFVTVENTYMKAGGLNQVLNSLMPTLTAEDRILVMDADSALDGKFLEKAHETFETTPNIGGVGGTFVGQEGFGIIGWFQNQEYWRYKRDVQMKKGYSLVLTGTASVFPVRVLREVVQGRVSGFLPGQAEVYDTAVLTEDNELSLAIQTLGYRIIQPNGCSLVTEVMPTWRALAKQRLRWKRGALENLLDYGFTKVTAKYWGRQILSFLTVLVSMLYIFSLCLIPFMGFSLRPPWIALGVVFSVSQAITVNLRGWKHSLLALTVIPETCYDLFLQMVQAYAFWCALRKTKKVW